MTSRGICSIARGGETQPSRRKPDAARLYDGNRKRQHGGRQNNETRKRENGELAESVPAANGMAQQRRAGRRQREGGEKAERRPHHAQPRESQKRSGRRYLVHGRRLFAACMQVEAAGESPRWEGMLRRCEKAGRQREGGEGTGGSL